MTQGAWRVPRPTFTAEAAQTGDLLETTGDAIPVRILIVQDGVMTGWDDGALGFDADAVWFSGRATSFRVFSKDLLPRLSAEGRDLEDSFYLVHPSRRVVVRVFILGVAGRTMGRDEAVLDVELVRLRRNRLSGGESQYPPLGPRPGLIRRPWSGPTSLQATLATLVLALLAWAGFPFLYVLALMIPVLWLLGALKDSDRAVLRRIAAAESAASVEAS